MVCVPEGSPSVLLLPAVDCSPWLLGHCRSWDPDAEVCLHVLRLVQSVVLEPEVFSRSASEFRSSLPLQRILAMAKSRNPHLQTVAQELLEDLRALERDV